MATRLLVLLTTLAALTLAPAYAAKGTLRLEGIPEPDPQMVARLQPYMEARTGSLHGWLPSGEGLLIGTNFGSTTQLHAVRGAMGARRQLTFHQEPVLSAVASRGAAPPSFIYGYDRGGNELYQLYHFDLVQQRSTLLTEGPGTRNESPVFARDGWQFAYSSTGAKPDFSVRLGDVRKPGETRVLLSRPGQWSTLDFSPDGKFLLVLEYRSILQSTLYEVEIASGRSKALTAQSGSATSKARYSVDGKAVYLLGDNAEQFRSLYRLSRTSGKPVPVGPQRLYDVTDFALSADGNYVALSSQQGGLGLLQIVETDAPERVFGEVKAEPGVVRALHFHQHKPWLAFEMSGAQTPSDAYTLELPNKHLVRWTEHELGGLLASEMVLPEVIRYVGGKGPEAYSIEALLYMPAGDGPHPVVISIHGGPEAQTLPGFDAWTQFLVRELKVAVLQPNVRGSSGYGRDFLAMDDGFKREASVRDIGSLLDWIADQPRLDKQRVAVSGGSYGGYMVLASLVAFADRLAAGIDTVGISNFVSFLQNTSPYRRELRRAEYGDESDPKMRAFLTKISPLSNASKIRAPLLVIQGANDPRVPLSESEQMVAALRKNATPAWFMVASDEGHGFRKRGNVQSMRMASISFLQQYLLTTPTKPTAAEDTP